MNILIISLAYAPYSGVGAARMTSLSGYLAQKGDSVTVICYDGSVFGEDEQHRQIPEGVERIVVRKLHNRRQNIRNLKAEVEKAVRGRRFQVCVTSVGPYESMFFIAGIWKRWRIPYIIDYRDPWLFEKAAVRPRGTLKYKLLLHDFLLQPVEKRALANAAKAVLVTENCRSDLIKRYGVEETKCSVVYNGYEDLPEAVPGGGKEKYVIGIAGKFSSYNAEAAEQFLRACEAVNRACPVEVSHIGNREEPLEGRYRDVYSWKGIKSHGDTMRELAGADALLISYAHISGLGTKVFDYIALNKPMIYVGTVPSELADFVGRFEHSYVCRDERTMKEAVSSLTQERPGFLTGRDVTVYSRERQNGLYRELISKAADAEKA